MSLNLSYDKNHNPIINDQYEDIRNDYFISSCFLNKKNELTFIFNSIGNLKHRCKQIYFIFKGVSEFETDFELFSSLENGKLYFDELSVVPLEYIDIDLPIKEKPYHSKKIYDDMSFVDSEYISKFEKLSLPIYFKISTKNGIDFYFTARRFEISLIN